MAALTMKIQDKDFLKNICNHAVWGDREFAPQILPTEGLHCISAAAHSTFTRDSIPASVRICLVFGTDLLAAVSCKQLKISPQHMAGNYEN